MDIDQLREEYCADELRRTDLRKNPVEQFEQWFEDAKECGILLPDAMTLATSTSEGTPSARTVVLRGYGKEGFVFYTDLSSPKSHDLQENPEAALLFYWRPLHRQIRIRGSAALLEREQVEAYFRSRPYNSKISSFISSQSSEVDSREKLESMYDQAKEEHPEDVPVPDDWGGYRVKPEEMEFWQGRENRLHDRFLYRKGEENEDWNLQRISP